MSIRIPCPGCGAVLAVPDSLAGQAVRCPHCKTALPAVAPPSPVTSRRGAPPAPAAGGAATEPLDVVAADPGPGERPSSGSPEEARSDRARGQAVRPGRPAPVALIVGGIVLGVLLVACAGAGGLAYLVYRSARQFEKAREDAARAGVFKIDSAVAAFQVTHGECPPDLAVLVQPLEGKPAFLEEKDLVDPSGRAHFRRLRDNDLRLR